MKNKKILRNIGIVLVGSLVLFSWWMGWFHIVFYVLGLYGAVYIVSYMFKTTAVIGFLLATGGFILYGISLIAGLYLLFQVLQIMFTGSFFWGLFLIVILGMFGAILYFIPMAIGIVLGYPLIFMLEDIERRFENKEESENLFAANGRKEVDPEMIESPDNETNE